MKLDDKTPVDEREASVRVNRDVVCDKIDSRNRLLDFAGGNPQVDVAALSGIGIFIVPCDRYALLNDGMEAKRAEQSHNLFDGLAHGHIGSLYGGCARHPLQKDLARRHKMVRKTAKSVIADAAYGLTLGHVVYLFPVIFCEIFKNSGLRICAVYSGLKQFQKSLFCFRKQFHLSNQ